MMFISPKLRSLSLALGFDELEVGCGWLRQGDTDVVNMLFRQIMSIAPGIRTLSIQNNVLGLPPTCLYRISDLKDLSALHARDCVLDFVFLRWLGGRPSLRTLSATIDMAELPPHPQDPEDEDYYDYSPFYGYNRLEHLHVRGSPNDIHLFLDTAVPCNLKTHTVEFDACAAPAAITRCIETIWNNDRTRRSVLRSLTLIYPDEYYTDEDAGNTLQDASLVDVIRPALAIRRLRRVTLTFHEIPSLSDAGVLEMVVAWPKLTALHITPATATEGLGRYRAGTKLSPALLVALARQCPRLAELTLPEIELGDGREMEKNLDMPVVGQRAMRRLRLLFCHWAAHEDVRYTAAVFLDRLFPCLDLHPSFEGEDEEGEEDGRSGWSWDERGREAEKAWRRIEEYLYAMQLGRRHRAVLKDATSL